MTALSSGVPSLADYDCLLATDLFRRADEEMLKSLRSLGYFN